MRRGRRGAGRPRGRGRPTTSSTWAATASSPSSWSAVHAPAGLDLTMRDVFKHPTVAELATVTKEIGKKDEAAEEPGEDETCGPVPLTPVMSWWREHGGETRDFSQSMTVRAPLGLTRDALVDSVQALLDHHPALRLRFGTAEGRPDEGRSWTLETLAPGAVRAEDHVRHVLADTDPSDARTNTGDTDPGADSEADADLPRLLRRVEHEARDRLDPESGAMLEAVFVDRGPHRRTRDARRAPLRRRRGLLAHPAARPGRRLHSRRGRAEARTARRGHLVPAVGAAARGARARKVPARTRRRCGRRLSPDRTPRWLRPTPWRRRAAWGT